MSKMAKHEDKFFHPKDTLDKFFEVGILIKLLDGILQTISGLALLLIQPEHIAEWAHKLTASELAEDPHDFLATHINHWANGYTKSMATFAAIYLLSHGIIKVVLIFEVMRNHLWAYIALIVVTAGFIVFQVIHLTEKVSFGFIFLTVVDIAVIYLTIREYKKQKALRDAKPQAEE